MTIKIHEAATPVAIEAIAEAKTGPRYHVRLIEGPRWGSSGFYTSEALDQAVSDNVFKAGTKAYLDHPARGDRPERSLRDLVGVYESATRGPDGVYSVLNVYPHMAEVVESLASGGTLDLSIRAVAEGRNGEAEGRKGPIIERLTKAYSVDLVTEAGAGGRVLELIESARASAPAEEAATRDRRDQLDRALRDTYEDRARDRHVWLRDFDDVTQTVWFELGPEMWQQSYTVSADDLSVALTGERFEVRAVTTYHPVTSAGPIGESAPMSTTPKEPAMEITEAKYAELTAAAERVTALEAELATEKQRADAAEADARTVAREAYAQQVTATLAASDLPIVARDRVADALNLAEEASIPADPAATITAAIEAETRYLAAVAPKPGLGFNAAPGGYTSTRTRDAWGGTTKKEA